jgi:hypothetical protein
VLGFVRWQIVKVQDGVAVDDRDRACDARIETANYNLSHCSNTLLIESLLKPNASASTWSS